MYIALNTMDYVFTYNSHPAIRFCLYEIKEIHLLLHSIYEYIGSIILRIFPRSKFIYIDILHQRGIFKFENITTVSSEVCNFKGPLHKHGLHGKHNIELNCFCATSSLYVKHEQIKLSSIYMYNKFVYMLHDIVLSLMYLLLTIILNTCLYGIKFTFLYALNKIISIQHWNP